MATTLKGIPASRGLAKGPAWRLERAPLEIPRYCPEDVRMEIQRLSEARLLAKQQLQNLVEQMTQQVGASEAAILSAQTLFLEDRALVNKAEANIASGLNAEAAWWDAAEYFAQQLESLPDETLRARAADVRDVGQRVVEILLGIQSEQSLEKRVVLIARDLAPSQTASLDTTKVAAICTAEGGATSHTAILAKALGIPAVVGLGSAILQVPDGTLLLVDGTAGTALIGAEAGELHDFESRLYLEGEREAQALRSASQPAITRDGHRVEVVANVGGVEEARSALQHGAEGIGLLRTEFIFLGRPHPPDEHTQYQVYQTILDLMGKRPVVVRTLDIGGDKGVPYYDFGKEDNPFLGYRGIRVMLDHRQDLKAQLRALLRASPNHDLRIMFPMIATLDEVRRAKECFEEARQEVLARAQPVAERIQIGIMVEVPSVVQLADLFAKEVDFFSIGTNDLTQYTMAAERGNKRVAHLNDPCHPAILRQISSVVSAAHQAGIWVGVCGEMAGDLQAIPILLGLGIDELSMAATQIPSAKQVIREWTFEAAQTLAKETLQCDSAEAVRQIVQNFSLRNS
jgi:phosphoenolpyruvate-protein phosphotransferase